MGTLVLETEGRILYEVDVASVADHPIIIGRDRSCDWCTAGIDNSISSRHAELVRRRGSVWIRDLGSRNGLFFQGERVKEHRLVVGAPILLGSCKVTLEPPRRDKGPEGTAYHRLEQLNGPEGGRTLELKGDTDLVIGSDPASDIFVPDTLVSRQHAKLAFKKDGSCWVSDLGSRNGTTVNGTPVSKERLLRDGDVLSAAYVEFRFQDKDAAHVSARIGPKLLVAAATVAVGVMGYSMWNLVRPSAGRLLSRTQESVARWTPDSSPADFGSAFALLDQAAVARQSDKYAVDWVEQKARMEAFTNTIAGWKEVRKLLAASKWVSARGQFHALSAWTWNSSSAPLAHREEQAVETLVNAFIDARSDLRRTDWESDLEKEAFQGRLDALNDALAAAPSAEERAYIGPLRAEAEDLAVEFRHALDVFDNVRSLLAPLRSAGDSDANPDAAGKALAGLQSLLEGERRHQEVRQAEAVEKERFVPFFAPIVAMRLSENVAPLAALADAERQIDANLAAIAAARWDDVEPELKMPHRDVTDRDKEGVFMRYRDSLVEKNKILCGEPGRGDGVAIGFKGRLESLRDRGFGDFLSKTPDAFAQLFSPETLSKALLFVNPVYDPLPSVDSEPVCTYDRLVGVYEFAGFLQSLSDGTDPAKAAADYDKACGMSFRQRRWTPVVGEIRDHLVYLRSFERYPDTVAGGAAKLVVAALPDGEPNRCAEAIRQAADIRVRIREWCRDASAECKAAETERAVILGAGLVLLLADPADLERPALKRRAAELGARYAALAKDIRNMEKRASSGEDVSRTIIARGIPEPQGPFRKAWKRFREEQGRAP